MKKMLAIESCDECHHVSHSRARKKGERTYPVCGNLNVREARRLERSKRTRRLVIPKWCPL